MTSEHEHTSIEEPRDEMRIKPSGLPKRDLGAIEKQFREVHFEVRKQFGEASLQPPDIQPEI